MTNVMPIDLSRYSIAQGNEILTAYCAAFVYAERSGLSIPAFRPSLMAFVQDSWEIRTSLSGTIENVLKILNILGETL